MGLIQDTKDLVAVADKIRDDVQRYADGEKDRLVHVWERLDGIVAFAKGIKSQYKPKKKAAKKKTAVKEIS